MKLAVRELTIEIVAESFDCDPESIESAQRYQRVHKFGGKPQSSCHVIHVLEGNQELTNAILIADGGASGVHERSAVIAGDSIFVAVGSYVIRLSLPALDLIFVTQADAYTCFGIHSIPGSTDILSHGELEIARLNDEGRVLWSKGGRDIFSGDVTILAQSARAVDFEGNVYHFELSTGRTLSAG